MSSQVRKAEPLPVPLMVEMQAHPSKVPFYLHPDMIDGAPFSIVAVELLPYLNGSPAEPHTHDQDEIYILPEQGEAPIEIEVFAGEWSGRMRSPAALRIPAGVLHQFRVLRAQPGQIILGVFIDSRPPGTAS